ncbi:MAG: hypothetical protein O7A98_10980 [Acidobacteria bacterium]|nr:hypothetical protein [Acidobacteriota bacterium]
MSEPSGAHGVTGGLGDELGDTLPCHTTQLTQQLAAMQEERSQELRHGASASFMSPVAHPANVLIMGPGGYRFIDYIKVGLPLTLVCLAVTLLLLPLVWPLTP